ncbi:DUF3265 domain-containing protein [Vibrio parahaemolyticus]|nr:DUF3265 domain-containing protein [Vibrio parahaemolyticus]EHH1251708.1 DUF3265 domain-containing protein [Vibrio parahaemolyticus]
MVSNLTIYSVCLNVLRYTQNNLTNCLRVIRNAWHFYYALRLVFKVVCSDFGIALLTP